MSLMTVRVSYDVVKNTCDNTCKKQSVKKKGYVDPSGWWW